MRALVYDSEFDGWCEFSSPLSILRAGRTGEVLDTLEQAEAYQQRGCYVVGFVAYEAAPAFDSALTSHDPGDGPLALFGVFEAPGSLDPSAGSEGSLTVEPGIDKPAYESAFSRIKTYLAAGDSYQVNYTHRLHCHLEGNYQGLFLRLVKAQPCDHAMYLETDELIVCSVSPELFFALEGDRIRTEPMKGTRPRGRYPEEDRVFKEELECSEKDRAENLMIVDMIRNDLGRIAEPGSVTVDSLFELRRLPTVWQQVSRVSARSSAGLVGIFSALFPCASVTGAPKARTMAIIRELEKGPRGVYTGAIGMLQPGGKTRFNVAIRTLTADRHRGTASYGVGGGIVWDSDIDAEWQETLTKAKVLHHEEPEFQLLETMLYEPGNGIYLLDYHLQRLQASARYFGFEIKKELPFELQRFSAEGPERIRLLLSRDGGYEIEAHHIETNACEVRLKVADRTVKSSDRLLFHKTMNRRHYEMALCEKHDCDDVILVNERGEITETTIYNLYLEIDDTLLTPALTCGLLPGTYRQMMLDEGRAVEAVLTVEDLGKANRVFVSNAVRKLTEAVVVD